MALRGGYGAQGHLTVHGEIEVKCREGVAELLPVLLLEAEPELNASLELVEVLVSYGAVAFVGQAVPPPPLPEDLAPPPLPCNVTGRLAH